MEYKGKEDKQKKDSPKQEPPEGSSLYNPPGGFQSTVNDNVSMANTQMQYPQIESSALEQMESSGTPKIESLSELIKEPESKPVSEVSSEKKTNVDPAEEAAKLIAKYGDNYRELCASVFTKLHTDEGLVKSLLEQVGSKEEDLAVEMVHTMRPYQLASAKKSILKCLQTVVFDKGSYNIESRIALRLLYDALEQQALLPEVDYHASATDLKNELCSSNPDDDIIKEIFEKLDYNPLAINQLKLVYDGILEQDIAGTKWMKYFMLEETNPDEEFVAISGGIILSENSSSAIGIEFLYKVASNDNLTSIQQVYKVDLEVLKNLNKWTTKNDLVIHPGQEIKMPDDVFLPLNEDIAARDKGGKMRALRVTQPHINKDASKVVEVAAELNKLITKGETLKNKNLIIGPLKNLGNDPLVVAQLRSEFYKLASKTIDKKIHDDIGAFTWFNRSNPEFDALYNAIFPYLEVKGLNTEVQKQLLISKYQESVKDDDKKVNLWEGLTIDKLVDRAHEALAPGLTGKEGGQVDNHQLLSALASLKFMAANIEQFKLKYAEKYNSFDKDINKAYNNVWDEIQSSSVVFEADISSEPVEVRSLTKFTLKAVEAYLTADNLRYSSSTNTLEDATSRYQLKYENQAPVIGTEFSYGTFIKYQKNEDTPVQALYVVQPNDNFWDLAIRFGVDFNYLQQLNKVEGLALPNMEEVESSKKKKRVLKPGDVIKVPPSVLEGTSYYRVRAGKVTVENEGLEGQQFLQGGRYQIHAETYNPYAIEQILTDILASQKGTGTGSLEFKVEIFLKARVAVLIYFQVGVGGQITAGIDNSRAFQISSKLTFNIKAGIVGIGSISKKFTILGGTHYFSSIKHFSTYFNHDIYNTMLANDMVLHGFLDYWDDPDRQDELGKNYYKKSSDIINPQMDSGTGLKLATVKYSEKQAPEFVGDDKEIEAVKPSDDFMEKQKSMGGDVEKRNSKTLILYNTDFMQLSYEEITGDKNKDNIGSYLNFSYKITAANLQKMGKGIKDAKKFIANPNTKDFMSITSSLKPNTTSFVKTAVDISDLSNPKLYKSKLKSLQNKAFGGNPKNGKLKADGGIEVEFCYQKNNKGEWVLQYDRASIVFDVKYNKEKLYVISGPVAFSGGVAFEATYKRSFYEKPGENSISYLSTVYNGFMMQKESDEDRGTRKEAFMKAQGKRLEVQNSKETDGQDKKKAGQLAEEEDIKAYWNMYQTNNTEYYTNDNWNQYRDQNKDSLEAIFANFLKPIIENKNKKNWQEVKNLKFIDAEQAKEFLGKNPKDALVNVFGVEDMENIDVDMLKIDLVKFEKYVLFNLYKEQQKYEFDYFYYKN